MECVQAAQEIQYAAMREGLERHSKKDAEHPRRTGAAVNEMRVSKIELDGNTTRGSVGMYYATASPGFFHALYQEFGSPTFTKDPWMRPAIENTAAAIRRKWREIIQKKIGVDMQ
jgi:hypothetical protein